MRDHDFRDDVIRAETELHREQSEENRARGRNFRRLQERRRAIRRGIEDGGSHSPPIMAKTLGENHLFGKNRSA
jgi:hypothetical protein